MAEILENETTEVTELKAENNRLKQRIRLLEKALFGPKSEREIDLDENQPEFEDLVKELNSISDELDQQDDKLTQQRNSKRKKKSSLKDLIPEDFTEEKSCLMCRKRN